MGSRGVEVGGFAGAIGEALFLKDDREEVFP